MTLSGKRKLFVDYYVGRANCNRSEAARLAGYASPGQEGHRLYRDPEVRAAIDERLRELAIGPEEILQRLSEQARGSMGDFIEVLGPGAFRIDLTEAEKTGKLRLVKRIGYDPKGRPFIEVYDAQDALLALSKRYHLFPDRQELTGADGGPVRVGISYEEALKALREGEVEEPLEEAVEDADDARGAIGV